jgi:methanogenic corrinoid protein MtbC1
MFARKQKDRVDLTSETRFGWFRSWLSTRNTLRLALAWAGTKELRMSGLQEREADRGTWPGGVQAADVIPQRPSPSTARSAQPLSEQRFAKLLHTIEGEIIPRLLLAHRVPVNLDVVSVSASQVTEFVRLVLQDSGDGPIAYALEFERQGLAVADIYLDLLAPAARELGAMWCEDRCGFATVTLGMFRVQQVVHALSPGLQVCEQPTKVPRSVLLAAVPGEQHTFGLSLVAEFFSAAGWGVILEPAATERELCAIVAGQWIDIAGFTCASEGRLMALASGIRSMRKSSQNPSIGVLVGGRVFVDRPDRAALVGADAMAGDARHVVSQARNVLELLGGQRIGCAG